MFREMRLTKQQLPDKEALAILERGGTGKNGKYTGAYKKFI